MLLLEKRYREGKFFGADVAVPAKWKCMPVFPRQPI